MTGPQLRKQSPSTSQSNVPSSSKNALSATATGTSYLILLQLFTRLLTFTFNQLILRYTTPSLFGFATIQLELLSSTILFLSREGFRVAFQRDNGNIQNTVNLAYIPFIAGIFGAVVGGYGFWRRAAKEVQMLPGFSSSIILYCLATVVELSIEPYVAVTQRMLKFKTRTLAEGLAVVARCVATCMATIYLARTDQPSALPFGLGQLVYAVVLAGVYILSNYKQVNLIPRPVINADGTTSWLHRPMLWLAFSVTGQSLFKHVLTEGDKLVLTFLTTPYTQGVYAIISNYGSLIARVLFQPLEETLRTILPRFLSTSSPKSLQHSLLLILSLLKIYVLLALTIHTVIAPLIPSLILPILNLLVGQNSFPSNTLADILYAYMYYIPIMAVNGVTESFVSSVATSSDLARQSRAMVFCSIAFLGTAWTLLKMVEMGGEGLVWANCVNMGVRILWSCNYIRTWYSSKGVIVDWGLAFPARRTAVAAVVIGLVIRLVSGKADFVGFIPSVTLGGIGGLTLVGCMYLPQTSILIAGHILKENFFDLYMAWLHLGRKRNSGTENDAEMHMMDKLFN